MSLDVNILARRTPITDREKIRSLSSTYPHLMVDTETMARCSGAAPIAIAAVPFSVENGTLGPPLRVHVNLEDALEQGLSIGADTTKFWMEQSEHWVEMQEDTVSLREALTFLSRAYHHWCEPDAKVWARGSDFDFGLVLRPAYDAIGEPLPWSYSAQRDQRTLGFDRPEHEHVHDPVADAAAQALQMIEAPQAVHDVLAS